eukprot:9444385-Lingulodinium_polyedra.AAC.1
MEQTPPWPKTTRTPPFLRVTRAIRRHATWGGQKDATRRAPEGYRNGHNKGSRTGCLPVPNV